MKFTEQSQTKTKEKSQVVEAVEVSSKVKENAKVDSKLMYRNEMNSITFPNLTAMEFNMFFTICYFVIKEKERMKKYNKEDYRIIENSIKLLQVGKIKATRFELKGIRIKFNDLRIFLPQVKNKKRFYNEVLKFAKYKLRYIGLEKDFYEEKLSSNAPFFSGISIDEKNECLIISLTTFSFAMLNEFGNFMSFDMNEFCKFENKYTKSLFRLLKQYENSNYAKDINNPKLQTIFMSKTDLERFINAPSKYDVKDLERRAIIPSVNEIKLFKRGNKTYSFENVDYEKIYDESEQTEVDSKDIKRRNVKGFKFIFEKRKN